MNSTRSVRAACIGLLIAAIGAAARAQPSVAAGPPAAPPTATGAPAPATGQPAAFAQEGSVRWACGGVGADERAALAALRGQANLELLFVTQRRGGYLADVAVDVFAGDDAVPRWSVRGQGPTCLLSLPPGRWQVVAQRAGTSRRASVAVPAVAGKPVRAVIAFPEEPWDGIRASDAEKRQAGELP